MTTEATEAASSVRVTRAGAVPRLVGGRRVDLGGVQHGVRYATSGVTCRDHRTRCAITMLALPSQTVFELHHRGPTARNILYDVVGSVRHLPDEVAAVPAVRFGQSRRRAGSVVLRGWRVRLLVGDG